MSELMIGRHKVDGVVWNDAQPSSLQGAHVQIKRQIFIYENEGTEKIQIMLL